MAFIGILLIYCIFVSVIVLAGALFLGVVLTPLLIAIISAILYFILSYKKVFETYKNNENKIIRYATILLRYLLIFTIILSILAEIIVVLVLYHYF